jgi:hypothetical protein
LENIYIAIIIAIYLMHSKMGTMEKIVKQTLELHYHSETSLLAYQLWDKAGSPAGRDLEFWLQAEAQLLEVQKSKEGTLPTVLVERNLSPAKSNHVKVPTVGTLAPNRFRQDLPKETGKFRREVI